MNRIPARTRALALVLCMLTVGALAPDAHAQRRRAPQNTPPAAQPGQQATAAPAGWDDLLPSPHVERVRPRRWTIKLDLRLGAAQEILSSGELRYDVWEFDAATLVFPAVGQTASSILEVRGPTGEEVPAIDGAVEIADRMVTNEVTVLKQGIGGGPLPSGTWRAQWQIPALENSVYTVREVEFAVRVAQTCYETKFDERRASEIEWPQGDWPPEAAATFQPQMFVDFDARGAGYNMGAVLSLLDQWAEGRSVEEMRKQAKPVPLAKWLAGKAAEHVQVNGEGLVFDKTGKWMGFDTPGAAAAAEHGRGTEIDLPCMLVALYRAVGLPARLVIGIDEEAEGGQVYLETRKGGPAVRVWVEFALYDEKERTFGWVPVDVTAIRKASSRMPPNYLSRPLRYFGDHPDLDHIAPLAFHFHPPTSVVSHNAPALWGWFVTPTPPGRAVQQIGFEMSGTPRGGRDESRLPSSDK